MGLMSPIKEKYVYFISVITLTSFLAYLFFTWFAKKSALREVLICHLMPKSNLELDKQKLH